MQCVKQQHYMWQETTWKEWTPLGWISTPDVLAIKAELRNSVSLQISRTRNAYTKTMDFCFDSGVKIGRFCLLCSTLLSPENKIWIQIILLSCVNKQLWILIPSLNISHCHKHSDNLFISRGSIQIPSGGQKLICLRCMMGFGSTLYSVSLKSLYEHVG